MTVDIKNLIAAIAPDTYCKDEVLEDKKKLRDEVKRIAKLPEKEGGGYLNAADKAKIVDSMPILEDEDELDVMDKRTDIPKVFLKNPLEKHELSYEANGESLEPIYFWLLDTIKKEYKSVQEINKVIDNFNSTIGSQFFFQQTSNLPAMQEQARKMMETANTLVRSIINLIYDLREYQLVLKPYKDLESKDARLKEAALLSLKQRWLDQVDIKKGNGAIKLMGQNFNFTTLMHSFFAMNTLEEVEKSGQNDITKRILKQRIQEFNDWMPISGRELKKRFEVEKLYLQSQLASVKMYARWIKPYLKNAKALEQNAFSGSSTRDITQRASMVNMFNVALFELVLLCIGKYDPKDDIISGDFPKNFKDPEGKSYANVMLLELNFRSTPERLQQGGYGIRGKIEVTFTGYGLRTDEISTLKKEIEKDDMKELFGIIEGATDKSLALIYQDVEEILGEGEKKEEPKKEEPKNEDTNPFSALFSFFKNENSKSKKENKAQTPGELPKDSDNGKIIRAQAILKGREECEKIYRLYKKAHNMPS